MGTILEQDQRNEGENGNQEHLGLLLYENGNRGWSASELNCLDFDFDLDFGAQRRNVPQPSESGQNLNR